MTENTNPPTNDQPIKGRSVFLVETTPAGIAVQTALLTEDGKLLNAPAIFPDVEYAFNQVDELKRLISAHFSQAARLGAQVAAQQAQSQAAPAEMPAPERSPEIASSLQEEVTATEDAAQPQTTGRKTLDNLKKFVYSGLSQVSKIAQPSNTASPSPENTPHIETTAADAQAEPESTASARKPRASSKRTKGDPAVS